MTIRRSKNAHQATSDLKLFAALTTTWFFSTLVLALRLVSRRLTKNRLWWDDYCSILAYVRYLALSHDPQPDLRTEYREH